MGFKGPYFSTRRPPVQRDHSTFLATSSSFPHRFIHSTSSTSRISHGPRDLSVSNEINRRRCVPNRLQQMNREILGGSKYFPPMTSKTLSSGQILYYLCDRTLTDCIVEELRQELFGPLGFDIEYRPNFIKGRPLNKTALVQLASASVVLLVQVSAMSGQYSQPRQSPMRSHYNSAFPDTVRSIIEDPTIIKAGVGIQGLCSR